MKDHLPQTDPKKLFRKEFHTLHHVLTHSQSFLLIAHSRPDPDTIGATASLWYYLKSQKKDVVAACEHTLSSEYDSLLPEYSLTPLSEVSIPSFDVIIACDSVERGFSLLVAPNINTEKQISVILDHHHDITHTADITIVDPQCSSTCELLSIFFKTYSIPFSKSMATALLCGILGDTGNFQHSNTSTRVLSISSELLEKGAPLWKISSQIFTNKKLSTLRLWGIAFDKARIHTSSGMIVTGITKEDLESCHANSEDVSQVANMLATVPGVRFALIVSQHEDNIIKGSFRAEPLQNIDVSRLAQKLGGGGHALASGFEITGTLKENPQGWSIS